MVVGLKWKHSSRLLTALALAHLLWLSGCGGPSGPERALVRGTVTLDGVPIAEGTIVFLPDEGLQGPSTGGKIQDGAFLLPRDVGPILGPHRIEIQAVRIEGTSQIEGVSGAESGPSAGGSVDNVVMYIPEKYNTKSILKEVIKPGENELLFDLVTKS